MPELPDIVVYCEALAERLVGQSVQSFLALNPFVLRTAEPPIDTIEGKVVRRVERLGKRVVIAMDDDLFLVIHLMIAGRLRWMDTDPNKRKGKPPGVKQTLAKLTTEKGTLYLTEAGTKRRASIHLLAGQHALDDMNPGGLEVLDATLAEFTARARAENHTLKRVLTDPHILSGIGNAYSDEILHRAGLSPMLLSQKVDDSVLQRLYAAIHDVLPEWVDRLRAHCRSAGGFPEKVTAFRPDMAVHGRFGKPCPVCDAPVQRIVYASNETNYCARCQTNNVILKDRALSRLLKASWPAKLDE